MEGGQCGHIMIPLGGTCLHHHTHRRIEPSKVVRKIVQIGIYGVVTIYTYTVFFFFFFYNFHSNQSIRGNPNRTMRGGGGHLILCPHLPNRGGGGKTRPPSPPPPPPPRFSPMDQSEPPFSFYTHTKNTCGLCAWERKGANHLQETVTTSKLSTTGTQLDDSVKFKILNLKLSTYKQETFIKVGVYKIKEHLLAYFTMNKSKLWTNTFLDMWHRNGVDCLRFRLN